MLLKISLGIAILVGLATLALTHLQVAPKVGELQATLTQTTTERDTALAAESAAKADAKKSKETLETTIAQLRDATNALAAVTTRLTEQEERANKASAELEQRTIQNNEARSLLAQWEALGYGLDPLRRRLALTDDLERERNALAEEHRLLNRKIASLEAKLATLIGDELPEIVLPPGTKGNIIAVDPKYDFVVLDIGGNQGVLENAKMMVNRNGKLIGKVRITQVEPNRSIANVMPDWKQDDMMEGDQVLF